MESRSYALLAGVFVLALVSALVGVIVWFTGNHGERVEYVVVSRIPVSGLTLQAPVRLRGVDVGNVNFIRFDPNDPRNILVGISVDRHAPVMQGTFARLGYWGISGLTYVQLLTKENATQRLPPRSQIAMRPSFLDAAEASGQKLLVNAAQAADRVTHLLSDKNIDTIAQTLTKLQAAADGLARASHSIQTDVTKETLPKVNSLTDALTREAAKFDRLLTDINQQPQSLLFGKSPPPPGPGEPGFNAQGAGR